MYLHACLDSLNLVRQARLGCLAFRLAASLYERVGSVDSQSKSDRQLIAS
jgi:hypothetical protein